MTTYSVSLSGEETSEMVYTYDGGSIYKAGFNQLSCNISSHCGFTDNVAWNTRTRI